jgi:hypothetical protein
MGTAMLKCLVLVLAGFLIQGCGGLQTVEVSTDELNEIAVEDEESVIVTPTSPASFGRVETDTTAPSVVDLATTCSCGWETWRRSGGLICSGLRCNEYCDDRAVACVERYTCFPMGI